MLLPLAAESKGFTLDIKQGNFISADISPLYRVAVGSNEPLRTENFVMVSVQPALYKVIAREIIRWNEVLRGVYSFRGQAV
jgi:hypothetical protein